MRRELRNVELNEELLEQMVVGGFNTDALDYDATFRHCNCGGILTHVGDFWAPVRCTKCDESHYYLSDFDYFRSNE